MIRATILKVSTFPKYCNNVFSSWFQEEKKVPAVCWSMVWRWKTFFFQHFSSHLSTHCRKLKFVVWPLCNDNCYYSQNNMHYYPTALRRVQITPKTSANITQYFYSRGPVRQVFWDNLNHFSDDKELEWPANIYPSLLDKSKEEKQLDDNQLAGFPVQILFRFTYFCYAFTVNSMKFTRMDITIMCVG